jgi:hypothetical protein
MVQDATFTIRLATPDDIDSLTNLHCASFRPEDHVPVILGKEYVKATYRWQVSGEEAYTLVAESGGKIVGWLGACDGPYTWPMFKACFAEFLMSLARNPALLVNKRLWQRLFRRPQASDHQGREILNYPGIAQVIVGAVAPGFRGGGVFLALVEATKVVSKSRGSKAIRVGVYRANSSCQRVFVKAGWVKVPALATSHTVFYVAYLAPDSRTA